MRYTPFDKNLNEILASDLATLSDVHEGWYVEYKSQLIKPRDLAKSISSFANQYGGWLFIGIESDPKNDTAASYPGIPADTVENTLESLKNANKDLLHPPVFMETRSIVGPVPEIGMPADHVIVVVKIPQGSETPYVHNDGRVYMRIGDSSVPKPVADRSTFDILSRRGERSRSYLEDRVLRSPLVSKGEGDVPFIHISISSDPYETLGHFYSGDFNEFAQVMSDRRLPFDNIFSTSDGFIARQTKHNDFDKRVLTWEFSRRCHSYVTVPIACLTSDSTAATWRMYKNGKNFIELFNQSGLEGRRILDVNHMLDITTGIILRHRILTHGSKINGPFYIKAFIEHVWRSVPFLDLSRFLDHISKWGMPFIQTDDMLVPDGISLESFVISAETYESLNDTHQYNIPGSLDISIEILQALGISGGILKGSADELIEIGQRRTRIQEFDRTRVSKADQWKFQ